MNAEVHVNNNDTLHGEMVNEEGLIKQERVKLYLSNKSGKEELFNPDGEQIKETLSTESELQDGCFKSLNSMPASKMEALGNSKIWTRTKSPFSDRIPLQFHQIHETPESQLSSWSSITGDNSLSDLYCDDEFKLSLEFDPNMQLFTTIEEEVEQEQDISFPYPE